MFADASNIIREEFSAAKRACTMRVTRDLTPDDCAAIARLRSDNYFPDPCDPRYALGGIHIQMAAEQIARVHAADSTSHLVLLHDVADAGRLIACARFTYIEPDSVAYDQRIQEKLPDVKSGRVLFNNVVIVDKDWRRQNIVIQGAERKACDAIFNASIAAARAQGCSVAVCDVVVAPVANEVSLRYMTRHGMVELGESAPIVRDGQSVRLKRYVMSLGR